MRATKHVVLCLMYIGVPIHQYTCFKLLFYSNVSVYSKYYISNAGIAIIVLFVGIIQQIIGTCVLLANHIS